MDDPVRPSLDKFRQIYEFGFRTWAELYATAVDNPSLPESCFNTSFQQHPHFPPNLKLNHTRDAKHGFVDAMGSSIWASAQDSCSHSLPSFQQDVELAVASNKPTTLSATEEPEENPGFASWFAHDDLSYLPVLILAWSYILSARWTEVMPGPCSFKYTSSLPASRGEHGRQPQTHGDPLLVDIGDSTLEEARWWEAILAPGEGWQANMLVEEETFLSPWSVSLQTPCPFVLSRTIASLHIDPSMCTSASSSDARHWLYKFCTRHRILDQAHAALFAVVLLPSFGSGKVIHLGTFKPSASARLATQTAAGPMDHHWARYDERELDRLLTPSCNTRGIRPLLLSVFYESSIECNAVTPWFQGAISAIDSLTSGKPDILGRMFMERLPAVSPLWLGATVLGFQKPLLQNIRYGLLPIDIHAAAWSGTVQSFLQLPVSTPAEGGLIERADECRLLFLARSGNRTRVPVCQWKPFGATPVGDTDIEVRMHQTCSGHGLRYCGMVWDCADGVRERQEHAALANEMPSPSAALVPRNVSIPPISYAGMDYDGDQVSENATRSILAWLRFDGWARHEGDIRKHEWFDVLDDSDEEKEDADDGESDGCGHKEQVSQRVEQWVLGVQDKEESQR